MPAWQCTYRLQINADFDFEDLAEVAPYLSALGVSHAYLSPILRAARGSTHGYDVADATVINPEWGGDEIYARATRALREHGIGQLLDIVPNHMSISTPANPWWWDVLRHGPASDYFHFFDFGWNSDRRNFQPLRLPVLEDRYVRVLEANKIAIVRGGSDFRVHYGSWAFPVALPSYPWITATVARFADSGRLARLAAAFEGRSNAEFWTNLHELLEDADLSSRFDAGLQKLNDDHALVHQLLDQQFYRLAYWRSANESWFYRRFFDINTLAGLRIEQPDVFRVRHRQELRLARDGVVDGLRIDHIDGLRHPQRYLDALRAELPDAGIWVEKILAPDEVLPAAWPVQGTTGYEYLNYLNGLFVQPKGEPDLTRIYQSFTGDTATFEETLDEAKREVVQGLFGGELNDLVELFLLASEQRAEGRDWSRRDVEAALLEYVVSLPVYRTYIETGVVTEADGGLIASTIAQAAQNRADLEPELFDFLASLLRMELEGDHAREFVLRCQQLTGPAMAKGAEDTSFYRYARLLSLNEVGGAPDRFGITLDDWHAFCSRISRDLPRQMVATSTHDTKRGEDNRQRLNVLSEAPQEWERLIAQLSVVLGRNQDLAPPDRLAQYVFFQTVVGAWPLEADRAVEYMRKATREAKRETSWTQPNEEYDQLLELWIRTALSNRDFTAAVQAFVERIDAAARRNSLAQTVLKLTAPGLPDVYRGTEVFSYSLVDPDNRRPVDFTRLGTQLEQVRGSNFGPGWLDSESDLAKLWLIQRTLAARGAHEASFAAQDSYTPLHAEGAGCERTIAYRRGEEVCVIVGRWFLDEAGDASLTLPDGEWQNVFTGATLSGRQPVASLLGVLPAAVLVRR
ncbi:MAG: malto-oligosyltrehalose synthase [Dehalococcoidia bacterium]